VIDVQLKPGTRLKSTTSTTEVIVVKSPSSDVDLRCGGQPMVAYADAVVAGAQPDPAHAAGTSLGKRYADAESGLEVLCTKAGESSLSLGDEPLLVKDAKPLPSSD
jgi:hypothetical protein